MSHSKWMNAHYRRWRWNRIKHLLRRWLDPVYRAEDDEHALWLADEREAFIRWTQDNWPPGG